MILVLSNKEKTGITVAIDNISPSLNHGYDSMGATITTTYFGINREQALELINEIKKALEL